MLEMWLKEAYKERLWGPDEDEGGTPEEENSILLFIYIYFYLYYQSKQRVYTVLLCHKIRNKKETHLPSLTVSSVPVLQTHVAVIHETCRDSDDNTYYFKHWKSKF